MSITQAVKFYESLATDETTKKKVMEIKETGLTELVKIAREVGYDVEEADFIELMNDSDQFQLSDDTLNKLTSGCGGQCSGGCAEICGLHLGHLSGHSS